MSKTLKDVLKAAKSETVVGINHAELSKLTKETLSIFAVSVSKTKADMMEDLKSECINIQKHFIY